MCVVVRVFGGGATIVVVLVVFHVVVACFPCLLTDLHFMGGEGHMVFFSAFA